MWILLLIGAIALGYESFKSGYLGVGWGGDNIIGGGVRVFFSFIAGILVYRSNWTIKSRIGFSLVGVLLLVAFLIPFSEKLNFIVDPVIVIFYFPFLVALGAGAHLRPKLYRLCKFSGDISYPLYMIHYPFIWLFMSYVESKKPAMNEMILVMITGVVLLIALAYLIMIWLDIPIRKYFKNKMEKPLVFSAK
jgi:peptidoglycan/LPS O-acetylase OafA/YrhL